MFKYVLIIKYFELQNDFYMYTVFYYLHLAVYLFLATDIEVLKTDFFSSFYHCLNPLESFYGNAGDVSDQKIRQILSDYKKVFSTF